MKKLIHLWSALLIGLLVSGCSGKKAPSYLDDENKSALKANRISEYRVTGADEEGVEVTEVFGVRFGEVFSESKHGGKLAVVIPDVSATLNPDPTIWEWRRTDQKPSPSHQPPRPNRSFLNTSFTMIKGQGGLLAWRAGLLMLVGNVNRCGLN